MNEQVHMRREILERRLGEGRGEARGARAAASFDYFTATTTSVKSS